LGKRWIILCVIFPSILLIFAIALLFFASTHWGPAQAENIHYVDNTDADAVASWERFQFVFDSVPAIYLVAVPLMVLATIVSVRHGSRAYVAGWLSLLALEIAGCYMWFYYLCKYD
jgi:NADH:ubiquinone oxidoreductase subunit 6 (subunit J)